MPSQYDHDPLQGPFFTNITGFYRNAEAHTVSLLAPTHPASTSGFFGDHYIPNLNTSGWNDTLAEQLRGSWDWASTSKVDFNLKEKSISDLDGHANATFHGWTWVRGGITLYQPKADATPVEHGDAPGSEATEAGEEKEDEEKTTAGQSIEFEVYGLHHVRNGTYRLFGMPDGKRVDIRRIPTMFEGTEEHDLAQEVILLELEKDVRKQQDNLLLADARPDGRSSTLDKRPA